MKKSLKGALLSGLIFPGVGQLWLKRPIRGIVFIGAVLTALALMGTKIAQQAFSILQRIESEGGAIDLVAIVNSARASSSDDLTIKCASLLMIAGWLVSVIDAYILGSTRDREDQAKAGAKSFVPPMK